MNKKMNVQSKILRIIAILFILGGFIRIFANKTLFAVFQMEALWTDHLYFIYIYKVLGAFVILTGIILFIISRNLKLYIKLMPAISIGFVIIGIVMLVTGILVVLPPMFYVLDFVFCFVIAWFFYDMREK